MLKAILMILLAVISSSTAAQWAPVISNEAISLYTDPTTIRKTGLKVKMWTLLDYKTAQKTNGKMFMSVKTQNEYDCKEEQSRIFYANFHPKNMGGGEIVISSIKPREWEPNEPDSVGELLWKIACKQQKNR